MMEPDPEKRKWILKYSRYPYVDRSVEELDKHVVKKEDENWNAADCAAGREALREKAVKLRDEVQNLLLLGNRIMREAENLAADPKASRKTVASQTILNRRKVLEAVQELGRLNAKAKLPDSGYSSKSL